MTAAVQDWQTYEAVHTGPSWEKTPLGTFKLPELTVGYAVLDWAMRYLTQPDGAKAGQPWTPTGEQARIILWWYEVDETGRFTSRRGVLRRMKGWGKDPFLAVVAAVEMCAPCRFAGFDPDAPGGVAAKAEPAPWIQVAAVSKDQTRNTMLVFPGLFPKSTQAKFGVEIGKELISCGRGRIEAVTSSPATLEGARPTLVIMNETHHWKSENGGIEQGLAIQRNLAKRPEGAARAMEITNAHVPGENSWAEQSYDAFIAIENGKSAATGIFYDSLEANPKYDFYDAETGIDQIKAALSQTRGDSVWLDVERLTQEILDLQTPMSVSRRFYFNQIVAAEDAWVTRQQWDACSTVASIELGERVVLGFDGSKTTDSTALVMMRLSDGLIDLVKMWEKPAPPFDDGWSVPKDQVSDMVDYCFEHFKVVAFYSDVKEWEDMIMKWDEEYGSKLQVRSSVNSAIAWDMRQKSMQLTQAIERLNRTIVEGVAKHTNNPKLNQHFYNARQRENKWGIGFSKESKSSPKKVDGVAAAVLASMARQDYLAKGKPEEKRYGFAW
jgi:hypothetical protein